MPLMTQSEYAAYRGIPKSTITHYKERGLLKGAFRRKPGSDKLYIVSAIADRLLAENLNHSYVKSPREKTIEKAGTGSLTYSEARAEHERYRAALSKLAYEEKTQLLIDKEAAERAYFSFVRTARDALLSIPERIGAIVAAETDAVKVSAMLAKEIRLALEELSR